MSDGSSIWARKRANVTYDQVNDMLSPDAVSPEQLDDVMSIFRRDEISRSWTPTSGVALSTQAEDAASERSRRKGEGRVCGRLPARPAIRVRMYLREMGQRVASQPGRRSCEIAKKNREEGEGGRDRLRAFVFGRGPARARAR